MTKAVTDRIRRLSGGTILFFLIFFAYYISQIISYVFEVMRLVDMYRFYTHLLRIPDVSHIFRFHSSKLTITRRTSKQSRGATSFAE